MKALRTGDFSRTVTWRLKSPVRVWRDDLQNRVAFKFRLQQIPTKKIRSLNKTPDFQNIFGSLTNPVE